MFTKRDSNFPVFLSIVFLLLLFHDLINRDSQLGEFLLIFNYILSFFLLLYAFFQIKSKIRWSYCLLAITFIVLSLGSDELAVTYNFIVRVLLSLGFYFLGLISVKYIHLSRSIKSFSYLIFIFVSYITVSNILGFGGSLYGEEGLINTGYLTGARLYIFSFAIASWPLYIGKSSGNFRKFLYVATLMIGTFFVVLIFRRTAIFIICLAFSLYFVFQISIRNIPKLFNLLLLVVLLGVSFSGHISKAIEARGGSSRVGIENIGNEKRTMELNLVVNRISETTEELLFGTGQLFNDRGDYGGAYWRDSRRIHGDVPAILYGTGLIGLLSFLIFLVPVFYRFFKTKVPKNVRFYKYTILAIYSITLFTGGIYYFTYNAFMMFMIGSFTAFYNPIKTKLIKYV